MIQNRLLGLYYTTLHSYCEEFRFPSPPPPMEEVVTLWNGAFGPIRSEIETISFIARGKCMQHGQQPASTRNGNSFPQRPSPLNGTRRSTTAPGLISGPQARTLRTPSMPLDHGRRTPSPSPPSSNSTVRSRIADYSNATDFTTASILGGAAVLSRSTTASGTPTSLQNRTQTQHQLRQDSFSSSSYFPPVRNQNHQQQQQHQSLSVTAPTNGPAATAAAATAAAAVLGKKKPPPPPPKRIATNGLDDWVVAQYDFTGQGSGDLSFREGDRIRVVKRTETDQDWYVRSCFEISGPIASIVP